MVKLVKYGDKPTIAVSGFYGLAKDVNTLPNNRTRPYSHYISTGSYFMATDTSSVYVFEEESDKWYQVNATTP